MRFSLKRRNDRENFPFPEDGATVYETAPCLIWVPVDGADGYRVVVKNKNGDTAMDENVTANYAYPKSGLTAGEYLWNVYLSDGEERGWQSFSVSQERWTADITCS